MTKTIFILQFLSSFPQGDSIKIGLYWPRGIREKIIESNVNIHVYSPGARADNTILSFVVQIHKYSVNLVI